MTFLKTFLLIVLITAAQVSAHAAPGVTAIMGALESEVELLKLQLQQRQDTIIEHISFYSGSINGRQVVITRSGIGKVNAAIITTLLIDHFKPAHILFSGIAGGLNPSMHPGDVVIAEKIAYHDYGRQWPDSFELWATKNPASFAFNPVYFPADSVLLSIAGNDLQTIKLQPVGRFIPTVRTGTILTGDMFLSDGKTGAALRKKTGADAIEMEGAAVAQTAWQQHIPFLIIRSLSDSANEDAAVDFNLYGKTAAANSATIIMEILKRLPQ